MADAAGEPNVIVDSAYSMWQGIYPATSQNNVTLANGTTIISPLSGQQYLPIETIEFAQSPLLEAFTSCPTYTTYLTKFYNSTSYSAKSTAEKSFFATLPAIVGSRSTTLKDMYNVYDYINVNSIYNATFLEALPNTTLAQAADVANWLSYYSFTGPSNSSAGNIAGRGMMGAVITSMQTIANTSTGNKIEHYSLAYKPFLSLFNMTGAVSSDPSLAAMVAYSSMLAFEMRSLDNKMYLNMVFRNGSTPGTEVKPVQILGRDQVSLTDFETAFNSTALFTTLDWCKACNQTTSINGCDGLLLEANATAKAILAGTSTGSAAAATTTKYVTKSESHFSAVGAGFIGAALGIVVATAGCLFLFAMQKRRKETGRVSTSSPVPMDTYSDNRRSDSKNPFSSSSVTTN